MNYSRDMRDRNGGGYMTAGLVGAVAALGAVAAVLLSKKENRRRLEEKMDAMWERADEMGSRAQRKIAEGADDIADRTKQVTERMADRTKKAADEVADRTKRAADSSAERIKRNS
jgi:gas vesicle protein